MNREALIAYLQRTYGDLLTITSITADTDGLGVFADQVLAVFGAKPDLSISWYEPLAEYFLLDQLLRELVALPARVTVDSDTYDVSKVYDRLEAAWLRLRARLRWILDEDVPEEDTIGKVVTVHAPFLTGGYGEW